MGKIAQGEFEVLTTKADAIDKFLQLQGICREEISNENSIEFYCTKKGEIVITNPPKRNVENTISTNLFAEIIERDGKIYATYYTTFSKSSNVLKMIFLAIDVIITIFAIIFAVINKEKTFSLGVLVLGLAFFVFKLLTDSQEKENSSGDSEILIKELKKRVDAVNLWDK